MTNAIFYQRSTEVTSVNLVKFDGIEVQSGSGRVIISWNNIARIEKKKMIGEQISSESILGEYNPHSGMITVYLNNGKSIDTRISTNNGTAYIRGVTDLGKYEVDFKSIKEIEVIR